MWVRSIYNVMSTAGKEVWINLRVNPRVREEFKAAADLRGGSMSSLLHQYMIKVIREEKDKNLAEFTAALDRVRTSGEQQADTIPTHPAVVEDADDESVLFETTPQLTNKSAAKKSVPATKRSDKNIPKKARR